MQNADWIELVRLIPQDQHNKLVVTTLTGVDLNIETILRMDETFLVFRGRISGITEDGRVFFVPYRQIDFLQINRHVKEVEIHDMFGGAPAVEAAGAASGVFAAPAGVFTAVEPTPGSRHGQSNGSSPSFTPAPVAAVRPELAGIAARLAPPPANGRGPNPAVEAGADGPTPPRNSILERLRAQRNSVVSTKPSGR